jgi:hypothetical protein
MLCRRLIGNCLFRAQTVLSAARLPAVDVICKRTFLLQAAALAVESRAKQKAPQDLRGLNKLFFLRH